MKLTKTQLKRIIKEELSIVLSSPTRPIKESLRSVSGQDFSDAMAELEALFQPEAEEASEEEAYEAINAALSKVIDSELKAIRISRKRLSDALFAHDDPLGLLERLVGTIVPMMDRSLEPYGYSWQQIWTRMLVEELGLRKAWSRRPSAGKIIKGQIEKLMKSKLFRGVSDKDKAVATKIIYKAMKSLEAFGGDEDFYEEIVTDPFDRVAEPNAETLAAQAVVTEDSWLEALSAWSFWVYTGAWRTKKPKYHKWLRGA